MTIHLKEGEKRVEREGKMSMTKLVLETQVCNLLKFIGIHDS